MIKRFSRSLKLHRYLCPLILVFVAPQALAENTVGLRLTSGITSINTDYDFAGQDKDGKNWVMEIIQYIPEGPFPHSWGLEVGNFSVLNTNGGNLSYDSVSIFVEATPVKSIKWLRASIGTSGYFGDGLSENKVFGLRSSIGAEVPINKTVSLIGFLRRDAIYDEKKTIISSIQLGVQIRLW